MADDEKRGIIDKAAMSEWITNAIRSLYREEGGIAPKVYLGLHDGDILVCYPPDGAPDSVHPLDLFGPFLATAFVAIGPKINLVGFSVEAWVRFMKPDNENLTVGEDGEPHLPRGRLQELHDAGDTDVVTGLLSVVWETADVDHPLVRTSYSNLEDWGDSKYGDLERSPGNDMVGYVPEWVGIEWRHALEKRAERPDTIALMDRVADVPTFIKVMCQGGAISGVAVLTNNETWTHVEGAVSVESPVPGET